MREAMWWLVAAVVLSVSAIVVVAVFGTHAPTGQPVAVLYQDVETGCHYVVNPKGGITPRMGVDGYHVCERASQARAQ